MQYSFRQKLFVVKTYIKLEIPISKNINCAVDLLSWYC